MIWLICSPVVVDQYVPKDSKRKELLEWEHDGELNLIKQMPAVTESGDHGAVIIDTVGKVE